MKTTKDYINLMPKSGPKPRRLPGPTVAAAALLALGWATAFGWQWQEQRGLRERLAFLTSTKQERLRQLDGLYRELGLAGPEGTSAERTALIVSLMNERVEWSEVFKQFSLIAPAGLWFDSVEGTAAQRAEIKIRGGAVNYVTVSEFMRSMQNTGYFLSPQLIYAQKIEIQKREAIGFEILATIRKGNTPK